MGGYLNGVVAGVQVLQYLSDDLTLRTRVFLPHGPVHQLGDVLVEVGDEVLQVLLVSLRVQSFPANPLHRVPTQRKKKNYEKIERPCYLHLEMQVVSLPSTL